MSLAAEDWAALQTRARLRLLQMHFESGVGHIGGNLSCLDLLLALHHGVMTDQDQFILSKGHAAGAYYVTLWTLGRLTDDDLATFHHDGTRLCGHPPVVGVPEVLFATGSLGHGVGLAAGLALAKRLRGEAGRVFCVTSDGEWDEGSTWEALIFAAQRRLDNLTILVDANGLQGFGETREVADLDPMTEKFRDFGVNSAELDGHDPRAVLRAIELLDASVPRVLVARTVKGHGVSFMADRMEWHYLPMSEAQYLQAIREVEHPCATPSATP